MSDNSLTIIPPNPQRDAEALYALLDTEWQGSGEAARQGRIAHSHYDWRTSRVGLLGDELVTHYGVYDLQLRIGVSTARTAGINLVVTHPEQRNQGLMTATTWAALGAMREAGYALSLVCNATEGFYGRFGYRFVWPEHDFLINSDRLPTEPPNCELNAILPQQRADFAALHNAEYIGITGSAVRPTFRNSKNPGNGRGVWWADAEGKATGFVFYDIYEPTNTLWHDDSAGPIDQRLQIIGALAREHGCSNVRFERLHRRSLLGRALRTCTSQIEARYSESGGWMAQILNLPLLCTSLMPTFEQRLHDAGLSGWNGELVLGGVNESVGLCIQNGRIHVHPTEDQQHAILAGPALVRLILGSEPPDEIAIGENVQLHGDGPFLLRALFPAQDPTMSNDDL